MDCTFYRARYYSPTFQRFVAQDPIGFAGGDPNLYGYARENPTGFRDPSGHDFLTAGAGALIGALYGGIGAALSPCATPGSIFGGALVGGAIGGGIGFFDPGLLLGKLCISVSVRV